MEKQFFVYDELTKRYSGQYFAVEKSVDNSTEVPPISEVCQWDGTGWIEDTNAIQVPAETALWKIRVVLKLMQLEDAIATALDTLEEPTKTAAIYIWNYGTAIDRDSQTIAYLQSELGLSSEQVDEIFIQANSLKL